MGHTESARISLHARTQLGRIVARWSLLSGGKGRGLRDYGYDVTMHWYEKYEYQCKTNTAQVYYRHELRLTIHDGQR